MNQSIFYFFYSLAHRSEVFDTAIVFFAVNFPWVVIIAAGVFLLIHHEVFKAENTWQVFIEKRKEILTAFFSAITAALLAWVFKILIHLPRPFASSSEVVSLFVINDHSFPSGHSTFFMALAVSIFHYHRKAGLIFALFAILIGFARIVAGVHYPLDVFSGWCLGILVGFFFMRIIKK